MFKLNQLKSNLYSNKKSMVLFIFIVTLVCMYHNFNTRYDNNIRFVNLKDAVSIPVSMLSKSDISKETQKTIIKQYTRNLIPVIKSYARSNHVTIINASVIADGNKYDVTEEIIRQNLSEVSK